MTKHRKIHLLYEHGPDKRPFGSGYIRLLRPLTHPMLQTKLEVSQGLTYEGQAVEAVIVDRLWRPDISPALAQSLLEQVRLAGARFIYAVDDNLLALPAEKKDWEPTDNRLEVVRIWLAGADGVIVTTPALKETFGRFNPNIVVVPNALDERLLPAPRLAEEPAGNSPSKLVRKRFHRLGEFSRFFSKRKKIIGYMGTLTHDDDLAMILPALETVARRHGRELEFHLVGAIRQPHTRQLLKGLPLRLVSHKLKKIEYPDFMAWFSRQFHWDIAIAPLRETPFNRCKSDIKFLDYCAVGAAGIYSDVPAYAAHVRHQETGWLAENTEAAWIEALERLLLDHPLRERIAQNAARYLFAERVVGHCASNWLRALETLFD